MKKYIFLVCLQLIPILLLGQDNDELIVNQNVYVVIKTTNDTITSETILDSTQLIKFNNRQRVVSGQFEVLRIDTVGAYFIQVKSIHGLGNFTVKSLQFKSQGEVIKVGNIYFFALICQHEPINYLHFTRTYDLASNILPQEVSRLCYTKNLIGLHYVDNKKE